MLLHKTFRTGFVFLSWSKWVQAVVCYDQNLQNHKYLSMISIFLHETFRTGLIFPELVMKWVQRMVCYDQNLQKHKYLSTISIFLHETFRTGLIFLSWSKWVQTVVCYQNQNLQNINISAWYQYFCMKPSEQGLFFWNLQNSRSKWVQTVVCYDQNLQKHKYGQHNINMLLHESWSSDAGLHFSELFKMIQKWVQTVVCYFSDQNLCYDQNFIKSSQHDINIYETFRTGQLVEMNPKNSIYDQNWQKH